MSKYRVRRNLPDNTYTQLKSADLSECKRVLLSLRDKWNDLRDVPFNGEQPFKVDLGDRNLTVTQGERVVDSYVIERA